jgi:RNA polymerase sigma-32 factor
METQASTVDRFMRRIGRYPLLEKEEERELARAWRDHRDSEALDRLVGSHLRLVVKIARGSRGYGLPLADLIAEGSVGLVQAAEKFDPEMGNRFSTYATWWIRAAIGQYVMHNAHIVRVGTTAAQKKLFFNLRSLKAKHGDLGSDGVTPEVAVKIADQLGVTIDDVLQMDGRIGRTDQSLSATIGTDGTTTFEDALVDETQNPEAYALEQDEMARRRAMIPGALSGLSARERDILTQRYLEEDRPTLETLSVKYGVSRERIRQIEAAAMKKFRHAMLRTAN